MPEISFEPSTVALDGGCTVPSRAEKTLETTIPGQPICIFYYFAITYQDQYDLGVYEKAKIDHFQHCCIVILFSPGGAPDSSPGREPWECKNIADQPRRGERSCR